jgi:hypothetical protein
MAKPLRASTPPPLPARARAKLVGLPKVGDSRHDDEDPTKVKRLPPRPGPRSIAAPQAPRPLAVDAITLEMETIDATCVQEIPPDFFDDDGSGVRPAANDASSDEELYEALQLATSSPLLTWTKTIALFVGYSTRAAATWIARSAVARLRLEWRRAYSRARCVRL